MNKLVPQDLCHQIQTHKNIFEDLRVFPIPFVPQSVVVEYMVVLVFVIVTFSPPQL